MTKIANISLDIRKDNTVDNDPIILRQGENDVVIEASISNNGYPNIEIDFATFVAKKPDGTIISNDPVNISGNVISYPISKHLTESVGKIQDAYFMINNQITTCGFDISIIPSAQLDDTSVNYIPGIESINKFLESAEADWLGRIQQMKAQIDGLNIPDEFKLLMDKALSDAKAQYQPTIDATKENVENIVADLAAKKLDLENNSDELNKTIAAIKAQIASVNSFLDGVQKQIIEANASFTAGQQAQVSQSISDGQKKLTDSIASMQGQLKTEMDNLKSQSTQVIADLQSSSNAAITEMQNNQSTAMAKVNQDITDTKAIMQKIQNIAVGTNLYQDTRDFDNPSVWNNGKNWSSWYKTGEKFSGLTVMATDLDWSGMSQPIQAKKGETYTYSMYARYQSGTGTSMMFFNVNGADKGNIVSLNETWQRVTQTITITDDGTISARIDRTDNNKNTLLIAGPKLEKGSIATDYSLNPTEVLTQADYAKIKAAILSLGGHLS
ncbi:hypothetical protein CPR18618_PPKEINIP_00920 [Companilactobacillus paralimentarius]|uniref:phage head spike fiber domain-containing protein n=1 Tax=Companilactobacillus paralimentarius TaxID=83526 RepID=UPI00384D9061